MTTIENILEDLERLPASNKTTKQFLVEALTRYGEEKYQEGLNLGKEAGSQISAMAVKQSLAIYKQSLIEKIEKLPFYSGFRGRSVLVSDIIKLIQE